MGGNFDSRFFILGGNVLATGVEWRCPSMPASSVWETFHVGRGVRSLILYLLFFHGARQRSAARAGRSEGTRWDRHEDKEAGGKGGRQGGRKVRQSGREGCRE